MIYEMVADISTMGLHCQTFLIIGLTNANYVDYQLSL